MVLSGEPGRAGEGAAAPHGAGVVVVGEHQLHGGVALVGLQVRAGGADLPVQVARKAVLLHRPRAKLRSSTAPHMMRGIGLAGLSAEI